MVAVLLQKRLNFPGEALFHIICETEMAIAATLDNNDPGDEIVYPALLNKPAWHSDLFCNT
jgi:hypothetical protein